MSELSAEDILREKKTHNPNSITSISLDHKALSSVSRYTLFFSIFICKLLALILFTLFQVSCLSNFNNLDRLDLSFNSLTSLKVYFNYIGLISYWDFKVNFLLGFQAQFLIGIPIMQGLESCFNLKWLSVQQNKLHTLNGIEALTNLAVISLRFYFISAFTINKLIVLHF